MKNNTHLRNIIFLVVALVSTGMFTGCGENSTPAAMNDGNDVVLDGGTQTNEDTPAAVTDGSDVVLDEDSQMNEDAPAVNDTEDEVFQKGWYIRLAVEDGTLKESSTVFGYLEGAGDNKEKYDTEALTPFGGSYLYTTLYHTDFGSVTNYKSDYRVYRAAGEKSDTWTIKVHSGDENADVTLSWNGITYVAKTVKDGFQEELETDSPELGLMRVVDVETGDVMLAADEDMKITFNMNGSHQRTFEWMLLADGDPEPDAQPIEKSIGISAKSMKVQTSEEEEVNDEFTPPSFEKR